MAMLEIGRSVEFLSAYHLADQLGCWIFGCPPSCRRITVDPLSVWLFQVTLDLMAHRKPHASFPAAAPAASLDLGDALHACPPRLDFRWLCLTEYEKLTRPGLYHALLF